jgi:hypothetical protein
MSKGNSLAIISLIEDRTMSNEALILKAKAFAKERYNDGLDFFVECYTDEEWVEYIEDYQFKNWREMKARMLRHADTRREHIADHNGPSGPLLTVRE